MKAKIIQALIICAVIAAAFFAFHLREPVEQHVEQQKNVPAASVVPAVGATFTVPVDPKKPSHFGILGESRALDFGDEPYNSVVLNQLFEVLKVWQVNAIFFAGNLVSGVEKGSDETAKPLDNIKLEQQLQQFSLFYSSIYEQQVPFFPTLGDREIMIAKSADKFIGQFHLEGAQIIGDGLFYTVSAGQAFFAVIATDALLDGGKGAEENFSPAMLQWLDSALRHAAGTHKYLFVVGYEPAFPSTTTFSKSRLPQRDAFWKILVENKVMAYFSSKEHLFDRSNRNGVWQIITGGAGAPLSQGGGSQPFFHALVLTIPAESDNAHKDKEKSKGPGIQVIDSKGNIIEEFFLSPENQPLYQMRIS